MDPEPPRQLAREPMSEEEEAQLSALEEASMAALPLGCQISR